MSKKKYELNLMTSDEVKALGADLHEHNEYICETAGFIPLEVKMKQFEQNGLIAQFQVSDFDSNDYRDIYLNPDFEITPEDEIEDIEDKIKARNEYINELKKMKSHDLKAEAGTPEPEKENKVSETPENVENLQK